MTLRTETALVEPVHGNPHTACVQLKATVDPATTVIPSFGEMMFGVDGKEGTQKR